MRYIFGSRGAQVPLRCFLLAAACVGLALRFVRLGGQSLWVDEVLTLKNSYIGEGGMFTHFFSILQGPLVSLVMHFWAPLSSAEAVMRLPFAIAGALSVCAAYLLAKSLCDAWTALHTVFLVSFSPVLVWYSQEIRGYAFVVLASILATYFFVRWLGRPSTRNALFYGICLLFGLVSNLSAAFVVAAHFVYLVLTPTKRKLVGRWLVAVFVVLLVFSPWMREIIQRAQSAPQAGAGSEPLMGGGGLSLLSVPYSVFTYSYGYSLGPSVRALQAGRAEAVSGAWIWIVLGAVGFAVPLIVGIARLARTDRNLLILLLTWFLVPVCAVCLTSALGAKAFSARYALVAVPAYLMMVGHGLAAITRTRFWPCVGLPVALLVISMWNYFAVPDYGREDARAAAREIRAGFERGDAVLGYYSAEALEHYLSGVAPVEVFGADDLATADARAAKCAEVAGAAERVWLFLCRERMIDGRGTIKAWFDQNLLLVRSEEFPGVRLHLYQRRGH
ncbi:MAG: glycosyltransferase family 39 protein [bacterium]